MGVNNTRTQLAKMRPHLDDYLTLSFREYKKAGIGSYSSGTLIGCGPYPMTAVAYLLFDITRQVGLLPELSNLLDENSTQYNQLAAFDRLLSLPFESVQPELQLTCLDINQRAVECGAKITRSLEFENCVRFKCVDALHYTQFESDSFVHIAAMVAPKREVLARVLHELEGKKFKGTVVMRFVDPDDIRSLLYEPISLHDIQSIVNCCPSVSGSSVVRAEPKSEVKTCVLVSDFGQPHASDRRMRNAIMAADPCLN